MDISNNLPQTLYSLRIDNSHNLIVDQIIEDFCAEEELIDYYLFAREIKKDGTPHYQGAIWTNQKLDKKQTGSLRARICRKLVYKFHPTGNYGFAIAKDRNSLAKYCNDKEGLGILTNLSTENKELDGKWKDKEKKYVKQKKNRELLNTALNNLKKSTTTREQFFNRSIDCYQEIYDNLPRASQVEYWIYKYVSSPQQQIEMKIQKYKFIHSQVIYDEVDTMEDQQQVIERRLRKEREENGYEEYTPDKEYGQNVKLEVFYKDGY